MRKPGGYGQLFCHEEGAVAFDRDGKQVGAECDTFSCRHCNRVVFVKPGQRGEDLGGLCKCCMGLICDRCVEEGTCTPLEKRIQEMERRQDTLRSYGMA